MHCIKFFTMAFACVMLSTRCCSSIVYNVYSLDHFIELVEKIERNQTNILQVASYIRQLGYDDDYWTKVVGTALPLPAGVLTSTETNVLKNMVAHRYVGSREIGVVLLPTGETIAMGHVINGICAGLNRFTEMSLNSWSPGSTRTVDNLQAATLAKELALTALEKKNNPANADFGPGGSWDSEECPSSYTRASGAASKASDAQLLGDVDGLLLGYYIPQWARKGVRLGQLLRMYYSTGVCYDESFVSCKRITKLKSLIDNEEGLYGQVVGVAEAWYLKYKASYPNVKEEDLVSISKDVVVKIPDYLTKIHGNRICVKKEPGCELPANLVFVMDESGSIDDASFIQEKLFVSQIIDAFNISPRQTNVAIVEFSTNAAIDIGLQDYGSKTRLKCAIPKLKQADGWTHTAKALNLVKDQIFLPMQSQSQSRYGYEKESDVSNIMILLTDGKSNDKDTTALPRVVRELKRGVKDLTMIAIGVGTDKTINKNELKMIATDSSKHFFTADDFTKLLLLVKQLQTRTCTTPVQMDLDFTQNENNTVVTAYVFPGSTRYFALASQYFYGIKDIAIAIKPIFGSLSIYASRLYDAPGPQNYTYKLDPIPVGQSLSLQISDPCSGFNSTTCPPIYLAIYAREPNCACTEPQCVVPGQIKFTIEKGKGSGFQIKASLFLVFGFVLFHFI